MLSTDSKAAFRLNLERFFLNKEDGLELTAVPSHRALMQIDLLLFLLILRSRPSLGRDRQPLLVVAPSVTHLA
jgi:hypothetical protein